MSSNDWRPTAFVDTAPAVFTEQDATTERVERRCALLAFIRLLMAFDTAALLLIVALIDKAFAQAQRRETVTVAVGAFLLGLAIGGVAHLALHATSPRIGERHGADGDRRALLAWSAASFLAFAVGAGALAWFFLANWRR